MPVLRGGGGRGGGGGGGLGLMVVQSFVAGCAVCYLLKSNS